MSEAREAGVVRLKPGIFNTRRHYLIQLRKQIEKVLEQFVKPMKDQVQIADYGCGNMPYEPLVAPYTERYIGIDLSENPRAEIHIDPEGRIAMPDNQVDFVLSTQVLEHVENPIFYLEEALRILKPGGKLIISTHGYWMFHPDPTDYWRWTSTGLKKIITERGFEIKYFRGIIGRAATGLQLFQDGFLFKVPGAMRGLLAIIFQPLIFFFDKTTSQSSKDKDAGTFVIVAEKKTTS
ncbi:MAG TPA: class I SAM-dependent methyltransferase [Chitinophaga sp.]|uniref:class I SAM-dependent methyltransferase n=1 Tax=Chitinophaga sp. TaxID=1869181 RepID=UPI002C8DC82F|nr:class I SAM-dependent methyltransferase [Chitinophaga sp.]HVI43888.1 class I SAM-dependent methyltransferase [Chitinophaga sp.]